MAEAGTISVHTVGQDKNAARRISNAVLKAASTGVLAAAFLVSASQHHAMADQAPTPAPITIDSASPDRIDMSSGVAGSVVPGGSRGGASIDSSAVRGVMIRDISSMSDTRSTETFRASSVEDCNVKGVSLAAEIASDSTHKAARPIIQVLCYDGTGKILGEARVASQEESGKPTVGAATGVFAALNTVRFVKSGDSAER